MKFLLASLALTATLHAQPHKLIFDTDMGNDVDDVQALAMIHALQTRGVVELLAVTTTKDHPLSAAFVSAINTFYGRPNIPIGAIRGGPTPDEGKYLGLAARLDPGGKPVYPHALASGSDAPDAVALLRRTLAAQPDGSVHIAQVGFSSNLARLLDSSADSAGDLTGVELVRRKVRQLVVMAGAFDSAGSFKEHREFNVIKDIAAARTLAEKWPGDIVWSGFEVGMAMRYPSRSIREDYRVPAGHIVSAAYVAYCGEQGENPTWDLTCPLFIAFPDRDYFGLSEPGEVRIADDGFTQFHPSAKGRHRYLTLTPVQAARTLEAFVQLCSTPPTGGTNHLK